MLRSTHKAAPAPPPLPEGWTEHKAPTGHAYYYHAESKKSTYTRPTIEPVAIEPEIPLQADPTSLNGSNFSDLLPLGSGISNAPAQPGNWRVRNPKDDRPKHKKSIPGCEPWILVTTKFRRRFVYNPELGESFWKFPQDVLIAVAELDRKETIRKERRERGEPSDSEPEKGVEDGLNDEYEEVEVTDDEDMDAAQASKRHKIEVAQPDGPVEFNEDDFAHQLALMEQSDGEEQFGDVDFDEEPELNPDDARDLFGDLLADFRINPYTPWDQVITSTSFIEDPRYTCLPNMKSRREVFDTWSRERIAELKLRREQQEKKDPRIAYIALLDQHASPKLYWPEFKRKFKKEQAMRDSKLSDKDREKFYRDHITRLKLPQSTLKSDLKRLLEAQPLSQLSRSSTLETLPTPVLTDLRFISLRATEREPLIEAYIDLLDAAPETDDVSVEDNTAASKARADRERRENALKERERKVEEDRRKRQKQEKASRGLLREGEADLERAMRVRKDGLMGHFDDGQKDEMEE